MTSIVPLAMTRVDFLAVWTNQTLLATDFRDIGELWAFQIACIRKMGLIGRGHVTLSGSVKLGVAVTTLDILEGNICAAVWTYERGA